jgi:CRP/FNR family cyclic AMP-dependent transcriptional regulator
MKKNKNFTFNPKILKEYEIFTGLTEDQINQFCQVIKAIHFNQGDTIIQEGDVGNSILLLLDGKVEISQALTLRTSSAQSDTREKSLIKLTSEYHPFFGEMSLFSDDDLRTATVKASSACEIARIDKKDFFNICNNHPEIGGHVMHNIARVLSRRLKQANQNILKLTTAFSLIIES